MGDTRSYIAAFLVGVLFGMAILAVILNFCAQCGADFT
jgi:hypothetical protein